MISTLVLMSAVSWAQSFNIGGHKAVQDNRNHIWLCSIPQDNFGNDFTATVNYPDSLSEFAIDGIAVANGDTVVFASVEGGKDYTLTAYVGDSLITGGITFTWLPIVELEGTFSSNYSYGTVTVSEPDSAYAEPLMAKLKWRGSNTDGQAKNKHNYRIKFVNPEDSTKENHRFFGLRNDNCWILDAGQIDFLRVRNRVNTDLWLDMARRPWYSDTLPNVRNGSRGQMVEVVLNGKYHGIFNMCEPIDRKQLKLKRYNEENNQFNGALWNAYMWSRTVTMSQPKSLVYNSKFWDGFEIRYPDFEEIKKTNWHPLYEAVWFANRSDNDPSIFDESIADYFDMPVMEDYYIFIATIMALDNDAFNLYYACYDLNDNRRLTMVPWDLDVSLGQDFSPTTSHDAEKVQPERSMDWVCHLPMLHMMQNETYRNEIIERYKELRLTKLNTDSLVNRYRSAIDELENCGAASREEQRWSRDRDIAYRILDLSEEMDYVEDWLRRRMPYLDENVFIPLPPAPTHPKGDVNGDGEVNIADVNALIDIILGGEDKSEGRSDVNEDGEVNIADINAVIDIIFKA